MTIAFRLWHSRTILRRLVTLWHLPRSCSRLAQIRHLRMVQHMTASFASPNTKSQLGPSVAPPTTTYPSPHAPRHLDCDASHFLPVISTVMQIVPLCHLDRSERSERSGEIPSLTDRSGLQRRRSLHFAVFDRFGRDDRRGPRFALQSR